jgi:hypothetical protein
MGEGVSTFAGEDGIGRVCRGWGIVVVIIGSFVLLSVGGKTDDSELGWIEWRRVE